MTELRMRIWQDGVRGFIFGWNTEAKSRDTIRKEMLAVAEEAIDYELEEIFAEKEGN